MVFGAAGGVFCAGNGDYHLGRGRKTESVHLRAPGGRRSRGDALSDNNACRVDRPFETILAPQQWLDEAM